jgi:hypothetical protein
MKCGIHVCSRTGKSACQQPRRQQCAELVTPLSLHVIYPTRALFLNDWMTHGSYKRARRGMSGSECVCCCTSVTCIPPLLTETWLWHVVICPSILRPQGTFVVIIVLRVGKQFDLFIQAGTRQDLQIVRKHRMSSPACEGALLSQQSLSTASTNNTRGRSSGTHSKSNVCMPECLQAAERRVLLSRLSSPWLQTAHAGCHSLVFSLPQQVAGYRSAPHQGGLGSLKLPS